MEAYIINDDNRPLIDPSVVMMILGSLTIQYRRWLMGDADEKVGSIVTTNEIV